jgi:ABC-2 type transport system ATP-binding protein
MSKQASAARRKMGYLSEDIPLCKELSVHEHLKFQASHFQADPKQLGPLIEVCELKDVLKRPIGHLSRGFRQRVALAGTLVHQPKFLLLDEPTAGLDPHQVDQFRQLIKTVAKDCSLLLSTHILSEVEMMCDRCLILHEGKLLADVKLPFQSEKRWELCCLSDGTQPDKSWVVQDANHSLEGKLYQKVLKDHVSPADELEKIVHQKVKVLSYAPKYETLESLFLKITSGEVA